MAVYLIPFMIIGAVPAPAAATNKSQSAPCLLKYRTGFRKQAQRPEKPPVGLLSCTALDERKRTLTEEPSTETWGSGAFGSATQPWPSCNLINLSTDYD